MYRDGNRAGRSAMNNEHDAYSGISIKNKLAIFDKSNRIEQTKLLFNSIFVNSICSLQGCMYIQFLGVLAF